MKKSSEDVTEKRGTAVNGVLSTYRQWLRSSAVSWENIGRELEAIGEVRSLRRKERIEGERTVRI